MQKIDVTCGKEICLFVRNEKHKKIVYALTKLTEQRRNELRLNDYAIGEALFCMLKADCGVEMATRLLHLAHNGSSIDEWEIEVREF